MCINFIPIHQDTHTNHALFTLQLWFDLFSDKIFQYVYTTELLTLNSQYINTLVEQSVYNQHTHMPQKVFILQGMYLCISENSINTMKLYITHMYIHVYVRTYVNMYVHMYVRTYVCMYICLYVCMYICTYIHIYVSMYVRMYMLYVSVF